MTKKILFVCTQNVTRSMAAHHIMRRYVSENSVDEYEVDSAGTSANSFERPYPQVLQFLYQIGVDASRHNQKRLDEDLVEQADLIVCMSEHHREKIKEEFDVESVLYNEVVSGKSSDLQDDVEGNPLDLDDFLRQLVMYINKTMPDFVENIEDFL